MNYDWLCCGCITKACLTFPVHHSPFIIFNYPLSIFNYLSPCHTSHPSFVFGVTNNNRRMESKTFWFAMAPSIALPMPAADTFAPYRPKLFGIAYRMLGNVADAEDIVQEAFLRWSQTDQEAVRTPEAYLVTTVTRLCVDHLRSARVQRESYIGPWLPEPLVTGTEDTARPAELADSLSMAFLVILEALSPIERAVFLLHEVFDYSYEEVAGVVGKNAVNCRQIARRARQRLQARRPRFEPSLDERDHLLHRFMDACRAGSMDDLLTTLADDVTLYSDGGGHVTAARKPVHTAKKVAHFLLSILRKAPKGFAVEATIVNGQPGFLVTRDSQPFAVWSFHILEERIQHIYVVLNPEKLVLVTRKDI